MSGSLSRSALLFLARREGLKDKATKLAPLMKVAHRFIAGESIQEATESLRALTGRGFFASFDHLNEAVKNEAEVRAEVETYRELLRTISEAGLPNTNVSIKLTQFGLELDPELAYRSARAVVEEAAKRNNFVRVDMEGSPVTTATLDVFRKLRAEFGLNDVGVAVQAYLRRTEADVKELLRLPARIRLCKGAYLEPPEVAFPKKEEVDGNFIRMMRLLLDSGTYHGIATHDPKMIDATLEHAASQGIPKGAYEFQMLYGIRRDLQEQLLKDGHPVRIYVPYGKHWYPYFMRRLAERPANVWFVMKNFFQG